WILDAAGPSAPNSRPLPQQAFNTTTTIDMPKVKALGHNFGLCSVPSGGAGV
ncbi:hypothetical protein FS837_012650, partial [Tulasnella sp. UAMH 9824]